MKKGVSLKPCVNFVPKEQIIQNENEDFFFSQSLSIWNKSEEESNLEDNQECSWEETKQCIESPKNKKKKKGIRRILYHNDDDTDDNGEDLVNTNSQDEELESEEESEEETLEQLKLKTENALLLTPPIRQLNIRKQHIRRSFIG